MKYYFFLFVFLFSFDLSFSQTMEKEEIISFQHKLNEEYKDSLHSPLSKNDRLKFTRHDFYAIGLEYKVTANFILTPHEKPFKMATTKGQARDYVKYAEIEFSIKGVKQKLNIYQSLDLLKSEEYKTYLFLPFKDLTNSVETYGGGRFIDLAIPKDKTIVIDFNKAYNPYCAYSDLFSCPITPIENTLTIEIKAGIKKPTDH